jgi:hypothetical protein
MVKGLVLVPDKPDSPVSFSIKAEREKGTALGLPGGLVGRMHDRSLPDTPLGRSCSRPAGDRADRGRNAWMTLNGHEAGNGGYS